MQGPCEHCGNPDKALWLTDCIYKGNWPSHRAFVLSTGDPPCAGDAYDEGQRELARDSNLTAFWITIGVVAAIALIWVAIKHF